MIYAFLAGLLLGVIAGIVGTILYITKDEQSF